MVILVFKIINNISRKFLLKGSLKYIFEKIHVYVLEKALTVLKKQSSIMALLALKMYSLIKPTINAQ